jgi:hypothetical protein
VNAAEVAFAEWAASEGWTATKNGWPDFMCRRGDELMAVEVKWSDGLSPFQVAACDMLARHGIPVFVWSPGGPLMPYANEDMRPSDAYRLGLAHDHLLAENIRLEYELREMLEDLRYLYFRAVSTGDRTPTVREIATRHPEWSGVRRKRRRKVA